MTDDDAPVVKPDSREAQSLLHGELLSDIVALHQR